jgi:ribulose-5-phosphate 4-epimerase/fuculose-1-phosphate aldolase
MHEVTHKRSLVILRNHGLLACGRSMAEAFKGMYLLDAACGGALLKVPQAVVDAMPHQSREVTRGQGAKNLLWPALLRRLDRRLPGYDA